LEIHCAYLIGLDYKRDRKTAEGKWIRKKNLTAAIAAFAEVEKSFENFHQKGLIPEKELNNYVMIKYRALLERGLINQAIAEESQGAKRDIYLQYAENLFLLLDSQLTDREHPLAKHMMAEDKFPRLQAEGLYALLQCYLLKNDETSAKQTIEMTVKRYSQAEISKAYYLSRVYYEQGMLAIADKDYAQAQRAFHWAEEADADIFLSTDQRLDLWIHQSLCCKELQQLDQAMLILSKVINHRAVSSLRIKAMFLRAELYQFQGKQDLARKQLEAIAKKGGEWALKAQNLLHSQ
jgi:hypothetical protein